MHTQPPASDRPLRILLCSAWQVVNIGDIAHTPGALAVLETHIPGAEVTLWAYSPLTPAARDLITRRFPRVDIVEGRLDAEGETSDPATLAAFDRSDFFLHGSGPATIGWRHAECFVRRTGRPFGVYGVTYGLYGCMERETLSLARFVYFRDSASLALARADGVAAPVMECAPDFAFGTDLYDEARADAWLAAHGLEHGKFLCCISRYRFTPFWDMPSKNTPFDPARHARNEEKKVADHAPLLASIIAVARQTDLKILLCPEDEAQMVITRDNLLAHLPADVLPRVVWRDTFWLPDEALSVYLRSAGLFGHEMHSPILCIAHGVPALVCRWAEQSTKGIMWRDLGLGDWLFDLDNLAEHGGVAPAVLALARDHSAARARAIAASELVRRRLAETLVVVAREARLAAAQPV
ncbi:MAG: polysaccharide pyruvyl transferase family protein [Burkholderiales bacterium]|nr:polysaccharide pyruvyl transferase family protein [Opitutaceae bacterium]